MEGQLNCYLHTHDAASLIPDQRSHDVHKSHGLFNQDSRAGASFICNVEGDFAIVNEQGTGARAISSIGISGKIKTNWVAIRLTSSVGYRIVREILFKFSRAIRVARSGEAQSCKGTIFGGLAATL